MPDQLQLRGGTTAEHTSFTGASKEVTIDTTKKTAVVHDASTAGGNPLMREDGANSALINGSAAEPALAFAAGDADNGIYSPGADQVAISTAGEGRLFVASNGNVSVTSTAPSATTAGTRIAYAGGDIRSYTGSTSNSAGFELAGGASGTNVDAGTSRGAAVNLYNLNTTDNNATAITFNNSNELSSSYIAGVNVSHSGRTGATVFGTANGGAPTEKVRITSDGKLGLGTSSPGANLEINESATSGTNHPMQIWRTAGGGFMQLRVENLGLSQPYHEFTTGTGEDIVFNPGGNVGIGTTSPDEPLHISASDPSIKLQDSDGTDQYSVIKNAAGSTYYDAVNGTGVGGAHVFRSPEGSSNEHLRIDSSGRLLVGTTSNSSVCTAMFAGRSDGDATPLVRIAKRANPTNGTSLGRLSWGSTNDSGFNAGAHIEGVAEQAWTANSAMGSRLSFSTTADGASSPTERMRINRNGLVTIPNTGGFSSNAGHSFYPAGDTYHTKSGGTVVTVNRLTNDGNLIEFRQANNIEGSIAVSGSTVSYNGAHLSRWSQLPGGATREEILRGTVLSNIDEMCSWGEEDNEQLNRMKVSDVEGDRNVSGVFQAWDDDDDTYTDDFYCAMTGDFVIRIAQGVTVQRGDLLMSAGDGTAKPQDDDIIRSKTVAKVTSTHVSETYADGSYCVPCVLMAC